MRFRGVCLELLSEQKKVSITVGVLRNKPGTTQVGARLRFKRVKFFSICKSTLLLKFYQFYTAEKYPKDTHKTRKPRFPQLETKKSIF